LDLYIHCIAVPITICTEGVGKEEEGEIGYWDGNNVRKIVEVAEDKT